MSSNSVASPNGAAPKGVWPQMAPYVVPPTAAAVAIVPAFVDMVAKSALQRGQPVPKMTVWDALRGGVKLSPTVGTIVGTQMVLQMGVEKTLVGDANKGNLTTALASSAVVGAASAPVLAVFNGQTMGWGVMQSLRMFTLKQAAAITLQETAFVGGLSAADRLAVVMKKHLGNRKSVDYLAALTAGALASLAGHPANTALTRWQSGLKVEPRQLMWGSLRKARGNALFSLGYKVVKEKLNSTAEPK